MFEVARVVAIIAFSSVAGLLPPALAGWRLAHHPPEAFNPRDYPEKSALWKGAGLVQQQRQKWAVRNYKRFALAIRYLLMIGVVAIVIAVLTAGKS